MLSPCQISFVEKHPTGSSLLAASLVNSHSNNDFIADAITLCTSVSAFPSLSLVEKYLIGRDIIATTQATIKPLPSYKVLTTDDVDDITEADVVIGLCFKSAEHDKLEEMVKEMGIEQKVTMVAYWDFAHLYSDNPEQFIDGVFEELQQRVRLLVGE